MPDLHQSVALLRHPQQLENLWLTYWHAGRNFYDFVWTERLENESSRESLDREIAWLLNLRQSKDYIISSMARLHMEIPSETSTSDTVSTVEFYVVDLYGKLGMASVELNRNLRWLTSEEVLSGQTTDRLNVNPWLVKMLTRADVIARHTR